VSIDVDIVLGVVKVGRDIEGGKVCDGKMDVIDPSEGTFITRDPNSNRVGVEDGTKLMVSWDVSLSGRFIILADPKEELKVDETTTPFAEMVTLTVAFEEGRVVMKSSKARNWKNSCGIMLEEAGEGPMVETVVESASVELESCHAPAHN